MPISTRDLTALQPPERLERLCQSLAMLEAIMCPDSQYRYYRYDPKWGGLANERLASCDTGGGDDYFLVFSDAGAFLKGLAHESAMTSWINDPPEAWPGLLDGVPPRLQRFVTEPAFSMESISFCLWFSNDSPGGWQRGAVEFPEGEADPDGSEDLLGILGGDPSVYVRFAAEYHERTISLDAVAAVYAWEPLSRDIAAALNTQAVWEDVAAEAEAIGYPTAKVSHPMVSCGEHGALRVSCRWWRRWLWRY